MPKIFTKASLISELQKVQAMGWIPNGRHGNAGGIGNTLEDLLGIDENNLPIPNASEWELKCQRIGSTSLTTLFHMEPSPRALRFVPNILLPLYGWPHQTIPKEMSFRQTICGNIRSDRGFKVVIDSVTRKVLISFDANSVAARHAEWLKSVRIRAGLEELSPQPYWGFDDLLHKAGTKLLNCFYVRAATKIENGKEFFHYQSVMLLEGVDLKKLLNALNTGAILVDFDARTHHNHGTKFRLRQDRMPELYRKVTTVV